MMKRCDEPAIGQLRVAVCWRFLRRGVARDVRRDPDTLVRYLPGNNNRGKRQSV